MTISNEAPGCESFKEINKKQTSSISEKKEAVACSLCRRNHQTAECVLLSDPTEEENFLRINNLIKLGGIGKFGESGIQKVLDGLSGNPEKQEEIKGSIIDFYKLEKSNAGNGSKNGAFEGNMMRGIFAGKERRIKIDKTPIKHERDMGCYVLRYHEVLDDGTIDPVVRIGDLHSLGYMTVDVQDTIDEIKQKLRKAA